MSRRPRPTLPTRIVHKAIETWHLATARAIQWPRRSNYALQRFLDFSARYRLQSSLVALLALSGALLVLKTRPFFAVTMVAVAVLAVAGVLSRLMGQLGDLLRARRLLRSLELPAPIEHVSLAAWGLPPDVAERVTSELDEHVEVVVHRLVSGAGSGSRTNARGVWLVARRGPSQPIVLVKKVSPNRLDFAREICALSRLQGLAGLAQLVELEPRSRTIYLAAVGGETVEQHRLTYRRQLLDKSEELPEKPVQVRNALGPDFADAVWSCLQSAHRARVCVVDFHLSNILCDPETLRPTLVDFGAARTFDDRRSMKFLHWRDKDCRRFNRIFGAQVTTIDSIKAKIAEFHAEPRNLPWYSGVDFGYGLAAGKVGSRESGQRKWAYIVAKHVSPVAGKRILDLGCNNANLSLVALEQGARQVVGVERDSFYYEQALFVHQAKVWLDAREYDLEMRNADFKDLDLEDLGHFDVVMALNCLYYIDEDDLERLLSRIHKITDCLLVQCNVSGQFTDPELNKRASVAYLRAHLEKAGFQIQAVDAPRFYYRPLLVAAPASSADSR